MMEKPKQPTQPDMLAVMREQVDGLDALIVRMVSQRTALTLAIGQEKQNRGISTMVSDRHTEVIGNYMDQRPEDGPLDVQDAVRLGETVMGISRDAQDRQRAESEEVRAAEMAGIAGLAEEAAMSHHDL